MVIDIHSVVDNLAESLVVLFYIGMVYGFIVQSGANNGFGIWQKIGRICAFVKIVVHIGHVSDTARVEPVMKSFDVGFADGVGGSDAYKVEANIESFLFYAIFNGHW